MEPQAKEATLAERAAEAAATLLEKHGYRIVERDWKCDEGGFEVVASRDGTLVLAQVAIREGRTADFRDVGAPERREERASAARRYLEERGTADEGARTEVMGVHVLEGQRALIHRWPDEPGGTAGRAARDGGEAR